MIPHKCNPALACKLCQRVGPAPTRNRLPCLNEGDVIQPCPNGGEDRHIRECDSHGRCTRTEAGKRVAVCSDCADYIPDWSLLPRPEPRGDLLTIPAPPPLAISPRSRTAVVTVASGAAGAELLAVSGPLMRRFANRVGADLVVLDWPGHPAWPMSSKFATPRSLDHYERILYVDADVLLRPGCVNPFDMCNSDEFGACDELPWTLERSQLAFGVLKGYERTRKETGLAADAVPPWYFNMGVYVASRQHQDLLEVPTAPIRPYHCGEQDLVNARILAGAIAGAVKVRLLDRRCNWQNWTDHGFRHAPPDAVLHWSGAGHARAKRVEDMRRVAGLAR